MMREHQLVRIRLLQFVILGEMFLMFLSVSLKQNAAHKRRVGDEGQGKYTKSQKQCQYFPIWQEILMYLRSPTDFKYNQFKKKKKIPIDPFWSKEQN